LPFDELVVELPEPLEPPVQAATASPSAETAVAYLMTLLKVLTGVPLSGMGRLAEES
jgi:hypothetical protein